MYEGYGCAPMVTKQIIVKFEKINFPDTSVAICARKMHLVWPESYARVVDT